MLTVHLRLPPRLRIMNGGMCYFPYRPSWCWQGLSIGDSLPSRGTSGFVFLSKVSIIQPNTTMVQYISLSLYTTTCFGCVWSIINTSLCSLLEWCSLRRRAVSWLRGLISGDAEGNSWRKFYILPTQCIYVFCMDLRTNSVLFPIQR